MTKAQQRYYADNSTNKLSNEDLLRIATGNSLTRINEVFKKAKGETDGIKG